MFTRTHQTRKVHAIRIAAGLLFVLASVAVPAAAKAVSSTPAYWLVSCISCHG